MVKKDQNTEHADAEITGDVKPAGKARIKVGIVGGAGYTGGELLRILINHPNVDIKFVNSKSNAGKPVSLVHTDLIGECNISFTAELSADIDILFLCLGHGDAKKFLDEHKLFDEVKVIDLSHDFRLQKNAGHSSGSFVYGLPELNREEIRTAQKIANPGCFATAIQLGLLPLAKMGLLEDVYTTGITGSTGAGQSLSATTHFSARANNISAYKTLTHQHLNEIGESISALQPQKKLNLSFVPWRGDFTRGIFISSQITCDLPLEELMNAFEDSYETHPFTTVSNETIFLKQVVNTNKCLIQLEKVGSKLVIHSIIDNLLKGASGQAVQNMNLLFGLDETTGLKLKAGYF